MSGIVTVPTEEEIRGAIARTWGRHPPAGLSIEDRFVDGLAECVLLLDGLYDVQELSDAELARLNELGTEAVETVRDGTRRRINEALVRAVIAFANEHPGAPRARS